MNPRRLLTINGILLGLALVSVGAYLFSSRTEPPLEGKGSERARSEKGGPSARPGELPMAIESSDRVFTDEQWQRQQALAGARQTSSDATNQPPVVAETPLAFLEVDPSVELAPEQAQAIQTIRESFSETMQAAGDPSSPAYLLKWAEEQNRVDELLTAYLGVEAIGKLREPAH